MMFAFIWNGLQRFILLCSYSVANIIYNFILEEWNQLPLGVGRTSLLLSIAVMLCTLWEFVYISLLLENM